MRKANARELILYTYSVCLQLRLRLGHVDYRHRFDISKGSFSLYCTRRITGVGEVTLSVMSSEADAMMCSWNGLKSKSSVAPLWPARLGTVASTRPGLSCWKMPTVVGGSWRWWCYEQYREVWKEATGGDGVKWEQKAKAGVEMEGESVGEKAESSAHRQRHDAQHLRRARNSNYTSKGSLLRYRSTPCRGNTRQTGECTRMKLVKNIYARDLEWIRELG